MSQRMNRTVLNWRWWAILPLLFAWLPLVAIDLSLAALATTGEVATDLRRWLDRTLWRRSFEPVAKWVRKGAQP